MPKKEDDIDPRIRKYASPQYKTKEKEVNIIFDKKQYSIRIPKKFAEFLNIKKDNFKFKFILYIPQLPIGKEESKLNGELIKNERKES